MKITLKNDTTIPLTKGTTVDVDNGLAMWLVQSGAAVIADGKAEVKKEIKKPAEKRTKKG